MIILIDQIFKTYCNWTFNVAQLCQLKHFIKGFKIRSAHQKFVQARKDKLSLFWKPEKYFFSWIDYQCKNTSVKRCTELTLFPILCAFVLKPHLKTVQIQSTHQNWIILSRIRSSYGSKMNHIFMMWRKLERRPFVWLAWHMIC